MKRVYFSILLLTSLETTAQFTPGMIVVSRVGDGTTALNSSAAQVELVEYTRFGVPTGVIVPLPVISGGAGSRACTNSGSATTEGFLNQSQDGRFLVHGGYDAPPGTVSVVTSTSDFNRVIARIDATGVVNTSSSFSGLPGNAYHRVNLRSVSSDDGTQFWSSGGSHSTAGVRYLTLGQDNIAGVQISTTSTNTRGIQIFNDQLYISTASTPLRIASVGTGLPTTSGQTITNLPNIPTSILSPVNFIFFDRDPAISGPDLLYFTSQTGTADEFGLFKYSFDGTNWNAQGKLADVLTNNSQAIGVTGFVNCIGGIELFIVRSPGSTSLGTEIRRFTDNAPYNSSITSNGSSIVLASTLIVLAGTEYGFRGIAMAPAQGYTVTGAQTVAGGDYNIIRVRSGGTATLTGNIVIFNKIIVESGGTLDMGDFIVDSPAGMGSSFEVQNGGTIRIGSANGIRATALLGNVRTCSRIFYPGAIYEYTGIMAQVSGDGLPTNLSGSLIINNSSGIATSGVTLSQATTITGSLVLTAGKLTTTTGTLLTLNYSTSFVTNASQTSFISGPVKKVGNDDFIFPVGIGSIFAPIGITNVIGQTLTDEFTAEYKRINPQSVHGSAVVAGMDHISSVEYWTLDRNAGVATKLVSLAINLESFCYDLDRTYVSRYSSTLSHWTNEGGVVIIIGPTLPPLESGAITSLSPISTFGDFTLITDLTITANPLPVKLTGFTAEKVNATHGLIRWVLEACCSPNAIFEIEKSADGTKFSKIETVNGSATNRFYAYHDYSLGKGTSYYRLKAIDEDGKVTYSKVAVIINDSKGILITSLSPNPINDRTNLVINSAKACNMDLVIFDITGRPARQWKETVSQGSNNIIINAGGLAPGIYHLAATTTDSKAVIKFSVQ